MWEKNITQKYTKDFGKNFDKTSKTLIEKKHENYSTFMYKCVLKYGCIKYEIKTLKISKQNIDENFKKTSIKKAWKFFGIAWRIKIWKNLHKIIHNIFLRTQENSQENLYWKVKHTFFKKHLR